MYEYISRPPVTWKPNPRAYMELKLQVTRSPSGLFAMVCFFTTAVRSLFCVHLKRFRLLYFDVLES